ncbi:MAG: NUDIX hydrolase [Candidatus Kariarchaeaceae archaeon]
MHKGNEEFVKFMHYASGRFSSFHEFKSYIKKQLKERDERLVDRKTFGQKNPKEAAILFTLIAPKQQNLGKDSIFNHIYLLLEKRSNHLNQNPGDMAFPGGRVDSNDNNLIETAYREAAEELGIETTQLEFIACMDEFVSSSQIIVRTIISWLEVDMPIDNLREELEQKYAPRTDETEYTVVIPLAHCFDPDNYSSTEFQFEPSEQRKGYVRYISIYRFYKDAHIWGLTASMIRRFIDIIFPNNLLPLEPVN